MIQWIKEKLQQIDKKTRKPITKYWRLHSKSCVIDSTYQDVMEEEVW